MQIQFNQPVRCHRIASRYSSSIRASASSRKKFQTEKALWDGSVCLSVCLYVTPLLQYQENHMSSGNKRNQPELKLAAISEAGSQHISLYTEDLSRNLHREFYTLLMNPCLEKQCTINYARRSPHFTCLEYNFQYSNIVMPYITHFYKQTKNTCHRTRRKASNISMIQYRIFEISSAGKHQNMKTKTQRMKRRFV